MTQKKRKGNSLSRRTGDTILLLSTLVLVLLLIGGIVYGIRRSLAERETAAPAEVSTEKYIVQAPEVDVQLLPVNEYSRPGLALAEVRGVVVHYTANPGTTAQQNRDYFAGLAESKITKASSHFVIGLEGEIIQCIPCQEIAYASNSRNKDTLAIECCIADDTGKFNDKTYEALVELTTWLMGRYHLEAEDVIRHYDVTQKLCPKYFVEHPAAWEQFKVDLENHIEKYGVVRGSSEDPKIRRLRQMSSRTWNLGLPKVRSHYGD